MFGPDHRLYIASFANDAVLRFQGPNQTSPGSFIDAFVSGVESPSALAFGPDGDLFVANSGVQRFNGQTGVLEGTFAVVDRADQLIFSAIPVFVPDTDSDGISDAHDNCLLVSNADQRDTNGDGHGNVCDFDYTDDCSTNFLDLARFATAFGAMIGEPDFDEDVDLDGNGVINFLDFGAPPDNFAAFFTNPPGPSAEACVPAT